ncbi:hypothetical protein ACQEVB_02435 [Pseudonocardia sp. CA-107938]|uniref:hypothetical protein n=1 Tax=Pseudonocardia sp. CA-107938 TaxID=3240021 RepID=UPI003D8BF251
MRISTQFTRIACGAAAAGVLLLGGAGTALAQEQTPAPGPPGTAIPQAAPGGAPGTQLPARPAAPAPRPSGAPGTALPGAPAPQVTAVPEGAPETGGGPADPVPVAALVGAGALVVAVAAGAVTVAVRRRP